MWAHIRPFILTIALITIWYGVQTAKAEPRLAIAVGTVVYVDAELAEAIRSGDRFAIGYVFDPGIPDQFPANPNIGLYPAVKSLSVSVGAYAATALSGNIIVKNDWYGLDSYEVSSNVGLHGLSGPGISGLSLISVSLRMVDREEAIFTTDELPMDPPIGEDVSRQSLQLRFEDDHGIPRVVIALPSGQQ